MLCICLNNCPNRVCIGNGFQMGYHCIASDKWFARKTWGKKLDIYIIIILYLENITFFQGRQPNL